MTTTKKRRRSSSREKKDKGETGGEKRTGLSSNTARPVALWMDHQISLFTAGIKKENPRICRKIPLAVYLYLIVQVAKFFSQFRVSNFAFVMQTVGFTVLAAGALLSAASAIFGQLRFDSRPPTLFNGPFRVPLQFD